MKHGALLPLDRCPHCGVANPTLPLQWGGHSHDYQTLNPRYWAVHICTACGGAVLAASKFLPNQSPSNFDITDYWPTLSSVSEHIPDRARSYLNQAQASVHAPAGAVVLAASSVDAMLKALGYKEGSLYSRIDLATKNHLITQEMSAWAHEIRLDANDQRHSDEEAPLPTGIDAKKAIEFATALAQFLFVLPASVTRGRAS